MNKVKKALALVCCAVLLVCLSVGATIAYLTANSPEVKNTFTTGDVEMTLDEADVDEYGEYVTNHDSRVYSNEYKLLPGHEYIKDPTVTILAGSEDCYVRAFVKVETVAKLKAAFPVADYPEFYDGDLFLLEGLVTDWSADEWKCVGFSNDTYEFWYVGEKTNEKGAVPLNDDADTELEALFETVVIPDDIDNIALDNLQNVKINISAQAIQADGFADAEDAWKNAPTPAPVAAPSPAPVQTDAPVEG